MDQNGFYSEIFLARPVNRGGLSRAEPGKISKYTGYSYFGTPGARLSTESTGQKDIIQKREQSAAAAAAAAAGVVLGSALRGFQLRVDRLLIEALVVEFALLGVAEDV